jgi:cell fate regulator YaaT (PSP1 superfamily)
MTAIVGVRFNEVGKVYHFDASQVEDLRPGDFVIVETSRGIQMGQVLNFIEDPPKPPKGVWKQVERKATPSDLLVRQNLAKKEAEALVICREKVAKLGFEGVKIVQAEISFDEARLTFLYSSEGEEDVNLSAVSKGLKKNYSPMKISIRRIGPRDVAKLIGGMGACGMENRCCSRFLTDFSPISIRMAKAQGVSLDPSEITGMCGRLRCCLLYEYEQYVEARKTLPKIRKKVITPLGPGKVVDLIPLRQIVVVILEDGEKTRTEFLNHEIEPWNEVEALRRKAQEPCAIHPDRKCDCNKANESDM